VSSVKFKFESNAVPRLQALPRQMNERIRKKALRGALQPVRDDLRRLWKAEPFRGKPRHRRAIADATQFDIRRGPNNTIQAAVGVRYGKRGGARASGRQRVWHLLEHGFRHVKSGTRIAGRRVSTEYVAQNRERIFERISANVVAAAAEVLR